jgi:membrane dipeptidase
MQKAGELRQIRNSLELTQHLDRWSGGDQTIGFVLSLEGADSIIDHSYLDTAYQYGLRAIGLGHYGPGTYAHGTNADAPLNEKGKSLVKRIEELGLIMDLTHLCDQAFWDVLEIFSGPVWASHNNCRAIVDHNRQFSDAQILEIIQRKGVIGVVFDAWMIIPGWQKGKSTPKEMGLNLDHIIHHIDHICQLAGNADHVGIGSDLDGGFGKEQCPADLETIADLQKLDFMLSERGYKEGDIEKILSINFLSFLRENLSKY